MENYTGKRLDGRYEIHEVLGVGGMAVVYKAYDNIDDRTVAVKILKEEYLASEEFRRRFKNESKAIAVLSHPNIVRVYDVSYGETLQYIVMEYVEGITLKEYIEQQGKLEIREAVHFTMQILRALQHAHDKGVVHRDIKPQNILLLSNGNIKVTDFGIARFSNEQKTMTGSAIGSVHYISPEQARGDTIDDKTDIYAVGVVLYEMLTGKVPFESDSSVSVALMQLSKEPTPPRELNPNIPVGLEQVVMRAMQKNVHDRYQSAAEMLLDIEEFKRNPGVKFREDYFVDKAPTKPISAVTPPVINTPPADEPDEDEKSFDYQAGRSAPIIKGVIIGVVAMLLIVLAAFYFGTTKLNGSKLTVPNFMGKNYALDIAGNSNYSQFDISVEYVQNSTYEDGIVISQEPRPNQKIDKRKNQILISVASTVEMVTVPDVVGNTYVEAKKILENRGFTVTATPQTSAEVEFGTVISTDPQANISVEEGSNIIIFYASDSKLNEVPELIGWDYETAKSLLESVGLEIDENGIRYEDSTEKYGTVIDQSIDAGEKVESGKKIALILSSGNPPTTEPEETKVTVSISLPSRGTTSSVTATLNSAVVYDDTLLLDGSVCTFPVSGSGESNYLKVMVDGSLYYTCVIDFTKSPPEMKGGEYRTSGGFGRALMPSVRGMSKETAVETLKAAGFYNIDFNYTVTDSSLNEGKVSAQSPAPSSDSLFPTRYDTSTKVILTIYLYEGETDEQSE